MRYLVLCLCLFGSLLGLFGCPSPPEKTGCQGDSACLVSQRCIEGVCRCADGLAACGVTCVDLLTEAAHCGACGKACPKETACQKGACVCPGDKTLCEGSCRDFERDPQNCGGCGRICAAGERCASGLCVTTCPAKAPDLCEEACVSIASDLANCGACGKRCPAGQLCLSGACACPSDATLCQERCVEIERDPLHCGGCGKACKTGERCAFGGCVTSCPASVPEICFGACVDLRSDPRHCGGCGKACKADQRCAEGVCLCVEGQSFCGESCIEPLKDAANCGGCGIACPLGSVCAEGICAAVCPQETKDICFGGCVDTQVDPRHCGACGKACQAGQICEAGRCLCPTGQSLCEGRCVETAIHPRHCGGCGHACKVGEVCTEGLCKASCPAQTPEACFGGCVSLQISTSHCGRCGKVCPKEQRCEGGLCKCPAARLLCGEICIEPKTDTKNCGGCGKRCKVGELCIDGACKIACPPGQMDCGGCTDTQIHPKHCGGCGKTCAADQACDKGLCACAPGRTLCGGICIDVLYNNENCGACGKACASGTRCQKAVCECAATGCPWILQAQPESGQRSVFSALIEALVPVDPKLPAGPKHTVFYILGLYTAQTTFLLDTIALPATPAGRYHLFLAKTDLKGKMLSARVVGSTANPSDFAPSRYSLAWDEQEQSLYALLNFKGDLEIFPASPAPPIVHRTTANKEAVALAKWGVEENLQWSFALLSDPLPTSLARGSSLRIYDEGLYFSGAGQGSVLWTGSGSCITPLHATTQVLYGLFRKDGTCSFLRHSVSGDPPKGSAEGLDFQKLKQGGRLLLVRVKGQVSFDDGFQVIGIGKPQPSEASVFLRLEPTNPAIVWKSEWEGLLTDALIRGLLEDANENILFSGVFTKDLQIPGGATLTANGDLDAVVGKLSPQGTVLWTATGTGSGGEFIGGMRFEPSGELSLLLGATRAATWGSITTSGGSYTIGGYKGRLSDQGQWLQADYFVTFAGSFYPTSFHLRADGGICVAGSLLKSFLSAPFLLQTKGDAPFVLYNSGHADASLACTHP